MDAAFRFVVGLGNPPSKYDRTRHNVGREFIDYIQARQAVQSRLPSFLFKKLDCFMNESGGPIRALMQKKGILPAQLLVVVDDFMIPFGTLRLRMGGSSGGHNGLKSIIESLGTDAFARLRIGVGPVPEGEDPADFVLRRFSKLELENIPKIFEITETALGTLVETDFQKAMSFANKAHL